MRIYDVSNTARVGFWCAAPNHDTAISIALNAKHARRWENLTATDVTADFQQRIADGHRGIEAILSGEQTGRIIGKGESYTMDEILAGVKKPRTEWIIINKE